MNKSEQIGNLAKALSIVQVCEECGKSFDVSSKYKHRITRFCSLPCANENYKQKCLENPRLCEIDGCAQKHKCKGLCAKHYQRMLKRGTFDLQIFPDFATRFWTKVNKTETCWLWIAGKDTGGYGTIIYKGKTQKAHRVAWQIYFGAIPDGMCVLHQCDVRNCIKPEHLFLGTQADNIEDMCRKGRNRSPELLGEKNPMSKLNLDIARDIRAIYKQGALSQHKLAKIFDVDPMTINAIVRNKRWTEEKY